MSIAISLCFLGYFIILFIERAQSLIRQMTTCGLFSSTFDLTVNLISIVSLIGALVLLLFFNHEFWDSIFKGIEIKDYTMLVLTAGVILVSGMVHTEYTIAPIQFGSYGILIVGMVLKTIENTKNTTTPFLNWYSLVFVTLFSMAIPVMYKSEIENHVLFHILEALVAIALVVFFTLMLKGLFVGNGNNLLYWIPMIVAIIGDSLILAMRWQEKVNTFVLIFIIASTVSFALGKVLFPLIEK